MLGSNLNLNLSEAKGNAECSNMFSLPRKQNLEKPAILVASYKGQHEIELKKEIKKLDKLKNERTKEPALIGCSKGNQEIRRKPINEGMSETDIQV